MRKNINKRIKSKERSKKILNYRRGIRLNRISFSLKEITPSRILSSIKKREFIDRKKSRIITQISKRTCQLIKSKLRLNNKMRKKSNQLSRRFNRLKRFSYLR